MGIPDACVTERSKVPEELFCSICFDLVKAPVQTSTHHIFCQECISRALAVQGVCPATRQPLRNASDSVKPLAEANPIMHRIWSKVPLRCPHALLSNCDWHGGPGELQQHLEGCLSRETHTAELRQELEAVRQNADAALARAVQQQELLRDDIRREREKRTAFDSTYSYGRGRIIELTQVIVRDLESRPSSIDSQKVFQCISNIQKDWERQWGDNPKHMALDLRMLLGVCAASTWFSQKQQDRFRQWLSDPTLVNA